MSDETTPKPNYYAILPANVRYAKGIEPGAKLLYAEITSLANLKGYAWATNEYFSDLYDVDTRTIQRWLESLKENNFIVVELDKKGFVTQRKIWISETFQNFSTTRQNCHIETTKMSQRDDKNVVHNIKKNTKKDNTTTLPPPKPKTEKPKSNGLVGGKKSNPFEEVSKEFPVDILSQAHKEFEEVKRKGIKVSDPVAYVRKICQRLSGIQIPSSQFEDVEVNREYAKYLEKKFYSKKGGSAHYSIAALDDKIEMVGPAGRFECLHYHMSNDTFRMLCEPWIKKLGL